MAIFKKNFTNAFSNKYFIENFKTDCSYDDPN